MIKLSVIIPTYKRSSTLLELIRRLQNQTIYNEVEIIIIDQNPESDLKDLLSNCLDERLKIIYQEHPNVSSARNNGFRHSKGNIIFFIDDDIYPTSKNFLKNYYDFMIKNVYIDVLSPYLTRNEDDNNVKIKLSKIGYKDLIDHASFFTISGGTFYKRSSFESSGGFDPMLFNFAKTAEDYEFLIRLLKQKFNVYFYNQNSLLVNENIGGGCELRTSDYWISRNKCVKSWCLRVRIHQKGKISISNLYTLSRSSFLNKRGLTKGLNILKMEFMIFKNAISSSRSYYDDNLRYYKRNPLTNHI